MFVYYGGCSFGRDCPDCWVPRGIHSKGESFRWASVLRVAFRIPPEAGDMLHRTMAQTGFIGPWPGVLDSPVQEAWFHAWLMANSGEIAAWGSLPDSIGRSALKR
jgi:hypothetical protein